MDDGKKQVLIGGKSFSIRTLGEKDAYHDTVKDGYGADFYRFCKANVPKDAVVFDIGANIGMTSCVLGQIASKVYAFEPHPDVFALLEENVLANGLKNVQPINVAVSDYPGVAHFSGTSAHGFLSTDVTAPEVKMNTVDAIVAELGISRLDFIKIDVEGFEPQALAGARKTIERFNPLIYMEFNSWCLLAHTSTNPLDFAVHLFNDFDVSVIDGSKAGYTRSPSATALVHNNVVSNGSVDDIILRRRLDLPSAVQIRQLAEIERQSAEIGLQLIVIERQAAELGQLQRIVVDIKASTSWWVTAPLRAARELFIR